MRFPSLLGGTGVAPVGKACRERAERRLQIVDRRRVARVAGERVEFALDVDLSVDFGFHVQKPYSGCSQGYWKNHSSWPWPYTQSTLFGDVFEDAFPGMTLHAVLWQGGGGLNALGRQTVAALLNASSLRAGPAALLAHSALYSGVRSS